MQSMTYAERQAERAKQFTHKVAEAFGFAPAALIESSRFDSWEDCSAKWGHTGDAYGYWQEAISQSAHYLKRQRTATDDQHKREENARKHGGEVCTRCGGFGGHSSWPGWVCFECGGRGFTVSL